MEPFKNLFSVSSAAQIARALTRGQADFSEERFLAGLAKALEPLELKDRMRLLADRIEAQLSSVPKAQFRILIAALAADPPSEDAAVRARPEVGWVGPPPVDSGLSGFLVWPLTEIVARRGFADFAAAMEALREMTMRFTAEFAIRPFLRVHPEQTLAQLKIWTQDPNEHVRRLVSEGSRPLLPWGERLPTIQANPGLTLPLLSALRNDPSEYVRRSVANHLNDHGKAHPEWVIETLQGWLAADPDNVSLRRLAHHATRTLIKDGHPDALALHGFAPAANVEIREISISPSAVNEGGSLNFRIALKNRSDVPAKVLFDYAIYYLKANGARAVKVFKGRTRTLDPAEAWVIEGAHRFRRVTTRRHYPGRHLFEARINGHAADALPFELRMDSSASTQ